MKEKRRTIMFSFLIVMVLGSLLADYLNAMTRAEIGFFLIGTGLGMFFVGWTEEKVAQFNRSVKK